MNKLYPSVHESQTHIVHIVCHNQCRYVHVTRNTDYRPSTQAIYTSGLVTAMQRNQPAAQIAASHFLSTSLVILVPQKYITSLHHSSLYRAPLTLTHIIQHVGWFSICFLFISLYVLGNSVSTYTYTYLPTHPLTQPPTGVTHQFSRPESYSSTFVPIVIQTCV